MFGDLPEYGRHGCDHDPGWQKLGLDHGVRTLSGLLYLCLSHSWNKLVFFPGKETTNTHSFLSTWTHIHVYMQPEITHTHPECLVHPHSLHLRPRTPRGHPNDAGPTMGQLSCQRTLGSQSRGALCNSLIHRLFPPSLGVVCCNTTQGLMAY